MHHRVFAKALGVKFHLPEDVFGCVTHAIKPCPTCISAPTVPPSTRRFFTSPQRKRTPRPSTSSAPKTQASLRPGAASSRWLMTPATLVVTSQTSFASTLTKRHGDVAVDAVSSLHRWRASLGSFPPPLPMSRTSRASPASVLGQLKRCALRRFVTICISGCLQVKEYLETGALAELDGYGDDVKLEEPQAVKSAAHAFL